jgi:hypothetical protein
MSALMFGENQYVTHFDSLRRQPAAVRIRRDATRTVQSM